MKDHFAKTKDIQKTKKEHECAACHKAIPKGTIAKQVVGRTYEGFYSYYLGFECNCFKNE